MDGTHIRNFKDFLLLYNQISEACFKRCTNIFISRDISNDEDICLRKCLQKHIQANHKMMEIFMEVQPIFVRKRIEEAQTAQAALEAQAAQAALEAQPAQAGLEPQLQMEESVPKVAA
ncbi:mitochondrial import inner membrane translocase subunit Tim10 B [Andrena cerasifolii]|uniref:mitochondrial import inner membrane translocase subunit Tim10 B n=1 Tax=Andrena cerasifolii TaxID=2819439 RepID=UPI0040376DB9